MSPPDFIRLAHETGYPSVDLRYPQIGPDTPEQDLASAVAALETYGVQAALMNSGGLRDDKSLESLMNMARKALRFRCNTIRISGGLEMCRKAADLVQPLGLRLCTQIHTGGEYESIASALETLERVGRSNYGVIVEPANLMMARQCYDRETLSQLGPWLFGVNIQSIVLVSPGQGQSLTLRDGTVVHYDRVPLEENRQIDLRGFFQALRDVSFDGFINVLEPVQAGIDVRGLARHCAEVLNSFLP